MTAKNLLMNYVMTSMADLLRLRNFPYPPAEIPRLQVFPIWYGLRLSICWRHTYTIAKMLFLILLIPALLFSGGVIAMVQQLTSMVGSRQSAISFSDSSIGPMIYQKAQEIGDALALIVGLIAIAAMIAFLHFAAIVLAKILCRIAHSTLMSFSGKMPGLQMQSGNEDEFTEQHYAVISRPIFWAFIGAAALGIYQAVAFHAVYLPFAGLALPGPLVVIFFAVNMIAALFLFLLSLSLPFLAGAVICGEPEDAATPFLSFTKAFFRAPIRWLIYHFAVTIMAAIVSFVILGLAGYALSATFSAFIPVASRLMNIGHIEVKFAVLYSAVAAVCLLAVAAFFVAVPASVFLTMQNVVTVLMHPLYRDKNVPYAAGFDRYAGVIKLVAVLLFVLGVSGYVLKQGLGNATYANILFNLKKYDQSEIYYLKVLEKNPENPKSLMRLGRIEFIRKNEDAAMAYFVKVLDMDYAKKEMAEPIRLMAEKSMAAFDMDRLTLTADLLRKHFSKIPKVKETLKKADDMLKLLKNPVKIQQIEIVRADAGYYGIEFRLEAENILHKANRDAQADCRITLEGPEVSDTMTDCGIFIPAQAPTEAIDHSFTLDCGYNTMCWAEGDYKITVYLNGRKAGQKAFQIKKPVTIRNVTVNTADALQSELTFQFEAANNLHDSGQDAQAGCRITLEGPDVNQAIDDCNIFIPASDEDTTINGRFSTYCGYDYDIGTSVCWNQGSYVLSVYLYDQMAGKTDFNIEAPQVQQEQYDEYGE